MICSRKRIWLCTALIVLCLCFIWGNSLLPGEVSASISDWVGDTLEQLLHIPHRTYSGRGLLRKLAHFTEFAVLGMLLTWLTGMRRKPIWLAQLLGSLAACADETIQCFVPGRGPGLRDVCIDSCGVFTGMIIIYFGYSLFVRRRPHTLGGTET